MWYQQENRNVINDQVDPGRQQYQLVYGFVETERATQELPIQQQHVAIINIPQQQSIQYVQYPYQNEDGQQQQIKILPESSKAALVKPIRNILEKKEQKLREDMILFYRSTVCIVFYGLIFLIVICAGFFQLGSILGRAAIMHIISYLSFVIGTIISYYQMCRFVGRFLFISQMFLFLALIFKIIELIFVIQSIGKPYKYVDNNKDDYPDETPRDQQVLQKIFAFYCCLLFFISFLIEATTYGIFFNMIRDIRKRMKNLNNLRANLKNKTAQQGSNQQQQVIINEGAQQI